MTHYAYFFTRQDISPEQQAVQTAHVAYKLGMAAYGKLRANGIGLTNGRLPSADETYFTLVGVRNLEALNAVAMILDKFEYEYEVFNEPDLNGGENTSIALYPVHRDDRGPLMAFNLLKMK